MTLIEHGELVRRALEYVQEERCLRPDASLSSLLDEAGMRFNLTPLDAAQLARLFSEKGDIVLDPFMGSGTTAIAAIRNKRCFIGIEKEKRYVQLATANIKAEYTTNPVNLFDSLGK
mgnify:CR=1 FL=1